MSNLLGPVMVVVSSDSVSSFISVVVVSVTCVGGIDFVVGCGQRLSEILMKGSDPGAIFTNSGP